MLAELRALDDPTALKLVLPVFSSVGLMLGVGWLGVTVMPVLTRRCLPLVTARMRDKARRSDRRARTATRRLSCPRDTPSLFPPALQVLLGCVLFLAIVLVPCCHQLGSSHLLGAFLAGLCFCTDHDAHCAWQKQVKRVLQ